MSRHREDINLGLWTAASPTELKPGQLSYLQNGVYLPGSQALQRARGRTIFGVVTATGTSVDGLRDVQFDNGDQYLVAMVSGSAAGNGLYRIAPVGDTGTFSTLASGITAGAQLEAIHYRNRFFLLNGVNVATTAIGSNRVVYLSATAVGTTPTLRQHGMLPVIDAPNVTTGSGTFSQTVTGYYEYWTTEVAKITADGAQQVLESTFEGSPTTVFVSSTAVVPTIQMPSTQNLITTDWRIYRSPKKDAFSDKEFPSGFMISEVGTATTAVPDTITTASASAFPSLFNGPLNTQAYADASANASAVTAVGGASVVLTAAINAGGFTSPKNQGFYGYNFGGFKGNVKGIEVVVGATVTAGTSAVPLSVTIGSPRAIIGNTTVGLPGEYVWNQLARSGGLAGNLNTRPQPATKSATVTASGVTFQTITYGSPVDRWVPSNGVSLSDTDFTSADFMVVLGNYNRSSSIAIDSLKVNVYYGATIDSTVQFPTVVYTFGDITSQVGKNGAPPSSSTGDLYEDALVVNDVSNPALIRYSAPGDPESFPSTYFLDFETRDNDQVTLIRTVNNRLVIGLETCMFRANYLPSERDASFDRGKAIEIISRSYGCVNPMCGCVFSKDGGPEALAFVSDHGIHGTDGYNFETYTDGLDWSQIISRTSPSNAICLINDRDRQELLFFYRNDANGNETYLCLHLSYASDHMVDGKLKISGPVNLRNYNAVGPVRADVKSAWTARRISGAQDVFIGYGGSGNASAAGAGSVYRENGTTIPAQDDTLSYSTRRMFLAGEGNEWTLNELYGHVGIFGGAPNVDYFLYKLKTGSLPVSSGHKAVTAVGLLHKVNFREMAEGIVVNGQVTATTFAQEYLLIDGEGFGLEDSGKT